MERAACCSATARPSATARTAATASTGLRGFWGPAGHGVCIQGHRGQEPVPSSFPSLICCLPQVEKTLEQLHLSSTQEEKEEEIRSPPEPVSPWLSLGCPLSLEGSSPPSSALCQALEGQVTPLWGAVHP